MGFDYISNFRSSFLVVCRGGCGWAFGRRRSSLIVEGLVLFFFYFKVEGFFFLFIRFLLEVLVFISECWWVRYGRWWGVGILDGF